MKDWKKPEIWELNAKYTNETGLIPIEEPVPTSEPEDCGSWWWWWWKKKCS